MLASIALETHGVSFLQAATISISRAVTTSPHDLLWSFLNDSKRLRTIVTILFTLSLAMVALASQFISTILLSDLGTGVLDMNNASVLTYALNSSNPHPDQGSNFVQTRPAFYPIFAESREAATSQENGITDTGTTIRALLPIADANTRQQLQHYVGKGTIFDSRVVCIRPNSTSELTITLPFATVASLTLNGTIITMLKPPLLAYDPKYVFPSHTRFSAGCAASIPDESHPDDWGVSMCNMSPGDVLDGYLVVNVSGTFQNWIDQAGTGGWNDTEGNSGVIQSSTLEAVEDNEWLHLKGTKAIISFSYCYWNYHAADIDIEAVSPGGILREPVPGWIAKIGSWDTTDIRLQLGQSSIGQNVLRLGNSTSSNTTQYFDFLRAGNQSNSTTNLESLEGSIPQGLVLCSYCQIDISLASRVHTIQGAVVRDILRETGQLNIALQAFVTTLFQMSYYDFLGQFDIQAPADMALQVPFLMPVRSKGLLAVATMFTVHLFLITTISVLFFFKTKYTMMGNPWQAVSQLTSEETEDVITNGTMSTDRDIGKRLKPLGLKRRRVILKSSDDSERVTIRAS